MRVSFLLTAAVVLTYCGIQGEEDVRSLPLSASPAYISEYMCAERWVEVYNPTDSVITLGGYTLIAGGKEYRPDADAIPPHGYAVFGNLQEMEEGDPIYIKDREGALVDLIELPRHKKNKSTVREKQADGSFSECNTENWTPGFPNTPEGFQAYLVSRHKENTSCIVFSEIMADNESAYVDGNGNYPDFVELYNSSDKTVDISGWGLSDDIRRPHRYVVPEGTGIGPHGYYVINCAKDAEGCAPFSIKNGEDSIFLCDKDGYILDEVGPLAMSENQSLAFYPGTKGRITTYNVSPGYPNTYEGAVRYANKAQTVLPFLSIWEVLPGDGSKTGWVEIRNNGDNDVNLKGFSITDENPGENSFTFSDGRLSPGSILLVKAGAPSDSLRTGFEFRKSSGLFLRNADGDILDCVTLDDIPAGYSRGRKEGGNAWLLFKTPTPGGANAGGVHGRMTAPVASLPSGQYDGVDSLRVELLASGTIYYTTDGSVPTSSSKKYTGPINLDKTTVIRAVASGPEALESPVSTWNYLVNEHHTLDVFCLTSDPDGLFSSSRGIYALGISSADMPYPYFPANFWRKWVRQSNVTFLPKQGSGFSEECGASIFGGWTRAYPKKSIKFKFKREYGAGKLHYKLFDTRDFTSYQGFVMRCGGQDTFKGMMRDDLSSYILDHAEGFDLDFMASRAVVVYINARYWGIYYLREKINKHFIAAHYGVPTDGIDIIMGYNSCEEGDRKDWDEFYRFVRTKDLSKPENYQYMKDHMDLRNYADWIIAECFIGNRDSGNVRAFKSSHIDDKWRWILYDTDMGWSSGSQDGMFHYLIPQEKGLWSTVIIRSLLKNDDFRTLFLDRLEFQMHNVWNKDNVSAAIDFMAGQIDGEVARNNKRWQNNYSYWKQNISNIRKFAAGRQAYMKKQFATNPELKKLLHMSQEELDRCFE